MIYTTYYSKLGTLPDHVQPYAISNGLPDGIQIPRLYEFAPLWTSVVEYKNTGDFERFRKNYLGKLERVSIEGLLKLCEDSDIALVCYEKDATRCHRSILAEYIRTNSTMMVEEWGCGS